MAKIPCYHVSATDGQVYGVAVHTKTEAKQVLQQRLTREASEEPATPIRAARVGSWDVAYGTTLCYGSIEQFGGAVDIDSERQAWRSQRGE